MEFTPGTILKDRYQIIRKLGQGGMGAVYLAQDKTLDHVVALKVNHDTSPQRSNQFLREARLLAPLRHPNLPRVSDYFVIGEDQFLVMDYIPGDNLEELLRSDGPFNLDTVLSWVSQLVSALTYLHNQKPPIIHRDIKPANIKLTPDGEVILVDFGIAKASASTDATTQGAAGFTPGFAPPEQYGTGRTGPFSDQFALAATIYALLTKHRPSDSLARILNQAVLTPIRQLAPRVPPQAASAIERALSIQPEERYASVEDFFQALKTREGDQTIVGKKASIPVLRAKNEPVIPYLPTISSKAASPSKRKISPLLAGVLIGAGLLISAGVFFYGIFLKGFGAFATTTSTPPEIATAVNASPTADILSIDTDRKPTLIESLSPHLLEPTGQVKSTPTPQLDRFQGGAGIAYSSNAGDGKTYQIWLMTLGRDDQGKIVVVDNRQLTFDEGDKMQPAWSPDGKKLLYVAPSGGAITGLDVWMLDLASPGAFPVNLSNHKGNDFSPVWSPDGKLIAFTNKGAFGTETLMNYIMNADGSNLARLVSDYEEYSPSFSPDMKYLLFVITIPGGRGTLYLRDKVDDYLKPHQFDTVEVGGRQGNVSDPAWSPSGEYIAYTRLDGKAGTKKIYLTRFSGRGNYSLLLSHSGKDYSPAWSPDSEWLVFTSEQDGNQELYIMDLTGKFQMNLTLSPWSEKQAAWQPVPFPVKP